MPIHIAGAVAPAAACPAKVSQRNAPGAISAIAFIVNPVKPNVGFISAGASAINFSPWNLNRGIGPNFGSSTWMLLLKFGAGWPENHRGHGRSLRAPNQPAYCSACSAAVTTKASGLYASPSKHESCFDNATRLICTLACCPEAKTRRHAGRVNNRQVSAKEKRVSAISRRNRKRKCSAAWSVEQVDRTIAEGSRAHDVFNSRSERKPALKVVGRK